MQNKVSTESQYTAQVRSLIALISGKKASNDPSVYAQAQEFFARQETVQRKKEVMQGKITELKEQQNAGQAKEKKSLLQKLAFAEHELSRFDQELDDERLARNGFLEMAVDEILSLSEGVNFEDSNRKSAKLLGTIQLLIDTESREVATHNERSKPLYKAVLCLRLLDRLYLDDNLNSSYVLSRLHDINAEQYLDFGDSLPEKYQEFTEQVKKPLVMAALLQDIGNYHPDAQMIIYGADGTSDPYRTLGASERKKLLQINYQQTLLYLVSGIGVSRYIGDYKVERELFDKAEKEKLVFIRHLLKSWINPEKGIGNLLKVPQIYTSIILSTKPNYNFKLLPQVYQVLQQNVEKGFCSKVVVDSLMRITGMFPQGFGVTYIPKDSDGNTYDRFEYAIVNHLYPDNFKQPICRTATRNLTFIGRGQDVVIEEECNLYFPETAKSLAKISKKRLNEILELLASNYQERQKSDILPRCWHAKEYFSMKNHQNLWNRIGKK